MIVLILLNDPNLINKSQELDFMYEDGIPVIRVYFPYKNLNLN